MAVEQRKFRENKVTRDIGGVKGGQFAKSKGSDLKKVKFRAFKVGGVFRTADGTTWRKTGDGTARAIGGPEKGKERSFPPSPPRQPEAAQASPVPSPGTPEIIDSPDLGEINRVDVEQAQTDIADAADLNNVTDAQIAKETGKRVALTLTQRKRLLELSDAGGSVRFDKESKPHEHFVANGLATKTSNDAGIFYDITSAGEVRAEQVSKGRSVDNALARQGEKKAGFAAGDKVEFTKDGVTHLGRVSRVSSSGKIVYVQEDGGDPNREGGQVHVLDPPDVRKLSSAEIETNERDAQRRADEEARRRENRAREGRLRVPDKRIFVKEHIQERIDYLQSEIEKVRNDPDLTAAQKGGKNGAMQLRINRLKERSGQEVVRKGQPKRETVQSQTGLPDDHPLARAPIAKRVKLEAPIGNRHVDTHLSDAQLLPDSVQRELVQNRVNVFVGDGMVPDMDEQQHLKNAHPRGWGASATWARVPGCYSPFQRAVVAGNDDRHGCASMMLHELGHAVDHARGNFSARDKRFDRWHRELFDKLPTYLKQGGPGGEDGKSELFAEATALVLKNQQRARLMWGDDFVDYMRNRILKVED